ncbi:MAG: tryptophan-rich sensory protein [Lachnospiraceae bacterium]|nr:tryptophan-rich sensory protein [Lachnospiraceae bacterium]MBQ4067852.1 tryptophan-rich sensory protein [Lachnospiraceae bacterium]
MIKNTRLLIVCIAIPLVLGVVSSLITGNGMDVFVQVNKPPLSPPGWLFPIVWTILYTLMGISSYLILTSGAGEKIEPAIRIYGYQLVVNFLWPTFFFNLEWYFFSFLWLVLLWGLVLFMILKFKDISKPAAYLNIPYFLWLTFAGYLNFMIWLLN